MSNFEEKNKYPIYMLPETMDKVEDMHKKYGCESRSEFIEQAVNFYCGYLNSQNSKAYLSEVLTSTIGAKLDGLETRMGSLMFKTAVELSMILHVVAATNDIDDISLDRLRGLCVDEVKRLRGNISFENALKFQKG